jgi:hypothetical protein
VIVIEAVTQSEEQAGAQSGIELPVANGSGHEAQYSAEKQRSSCPYLG